MKITTQNSHWAWLAFSLILLVGCSTTPEVAVDKPKDYLNTAEKNFKEGQKAQKNKNYEEAVSYFQYVKNQYPYSKFAALADLAIAETYMDSEQWLQAAESFQFFVQFHPKHEKVPLATFHIAKAYTEAIPKDVPLMPKSFEKDQGATKSAIVAWERFLRRYPENEKAEEARQFRKEARGILTEQEWAIATHYENKKRYQGAVWRYETIFNKYPESAKAPEAMTKAISLYQNELNEKEKAENLQKRLDKEYPEKSQDSEASSPAKTESKNKP